LVENLLLVGHIGNVKFKCFFFLLLVMAIFAGCTKPGASTTPNAPPTVDDFLPKHAQPKLPTAKIFFGTFHDNLFHPLESLDAELALTQEQEMTGMMFRTNILETDSMLFVLPMVQRAAFWMKNCPESISAAYITSDGVIQEIYHLEKNDTNSVVAARNDIRFVLETKEGWFTRHHILPGTVIKTEKGSLAETFLLGR